MGASGPHRVVIAGGGFAALEAMIGLRRLAGGRVELVLVSPERELHYPPLSVVEPFGLGEAPRFDLAAIARDHDAELHVDAATAVDTGRRVLRTRSDGEISFDSLLVTTGAEPYEAVPGALTFRGSADRPAFEALLSDIDAGRVKSDEHFVGSRVRHRDCPELEDTRRTEPLDGRGLHRSRDL